MAHREANEAVGRTHEDDVATEEFIQALEEEMLEAAEQLDFERAAKLRDRLADIRDGGKGKSKKREASSSRRRRRSRGGAKSRVPRPKKK